MRRVYLPTTLADLAGPRAAHAVTAAVREWYVEGELEELEYVALTEAAEASLRLLAEAPDVVRRRVVVAADVADTRVRDVADERFRSAVLVDGEVPVKAIASIHVDEEGAVTTVASAIEALPAADDGDDDAQFVLDEAEATELLWYDVSELGDLVENPS